VRLYVKILEEAIDSYGLSWDAPVELHIADEGKVGKYLKLSRKAVRINPLGPFRSKRRV